MKNQVCLMGGEVMPNVIGVMALQPEAVFTLASKESAGQVESLRFALKASGYSGEVHDPVEIEPYDEVDCQKGMAACFEKAGSNCVVNWTGGTKVMSWAARQAGGEENIYVDSDHNEIIYSTIGERKSFFSDKLGLNIMSRILASGHSVDGATTLEEFRKRHTPSNVLVEVATALFDLPRSEEDDVKRLASVKDKPYVPRRLHKKVLDQLVKAELIQACGSDGYKLNNKTILPAYHRDQTPQTEIAKFLTSTYLEVFIWSQLAQRHGFDDVAWNVSINPGKRGQTNQLDVLLFHNNRFITIDCKMTAGENRLTTTIEETYAVARKLGRLFSKWILVFGESRPLDIPVESQEARAQSFDGLLIWRDQYEEIYPMVSGHLEARRSL